MAEGWLPYVVEELQLRLATSPDPKRLRKDLKKLSALPVTATVLRRTGVGQTVGRLSTHEHVGSLARELVAKWNRLVPLEGNAEPDARRSEKSDSRKRPRDAPLKGGAKGRHEENCQVSSSRPDGPEDRQKKHKTAPESERPRQGAHGIAPVYSLDRESSGCGLSPPKAAGPRQRSPECDGCPSETRGARWRPGQGRSEAPRDGQRLGRDQRRRARQENRAARPRKGHPSPPGDRCPVGAQGNETGSVPANQKSHQACSREEAGPYSQGSALENPPSGGALREKEKEGGSTQRSPPASEAMSGNGFKKQTSSNPENKKSNENKQSVYSLCTGKGAGDRLPKVKEASNNLKTQEKLKTFSLASQSVSSLPEVRKADTDHGCEQPTMSFESYLNYDQPPKRKKKTVKTSAVSLERRGLKKNSKSTCGNLNLGQAFPEVAEMKSEKLQPTGAHFAKLDTVPSGALPVLPDPSSPRLPANYPPLPAFELITSYQPEQKVLSSPQREEEAGFTGYRMNSKMQVFSGSKHACLPHMMTLREQCIRVLKNNINSIFEVSSVPYFVLEPVLESCTPDQLYRIEKYNHMLVEETDKLWKNHCNQKFKKEMPSEHESWREMYLRLQKAREQRLRALTMNIHSAHANKPKGRQTKMIFFNSMTNLPSDISRRQKSEIGAAVPEKIKIKPSSYPTGSSATPSSSASGSSIEPISGTSSAHWVQVASSKKPAKKTAPLMAKTIRDFKNRFSRR
ncbi:elongin-A-like [Talpa occidentalis]|uniref:elongin-A-like n=1 Tax=Talpa occidentalis TaxID=50954 RepID=UPI00188F9AD7|nr:elongin-A-like [Talpa occidentalis]